MMENENKVRAANFIYSPHFVPFGPRTSAFWRGQFAIWKRVVIIIRDGCTQASHCTVISNTDYDVMQGDTY